MTSAQSPVVPVDPAIAPNNAAKETKAQPKGFWSRFAQAYADDWHPAPGPDTPTPFAAIRRPFRTRRFPSLYGRLGVPFGLVIPMPLPIR